MEDKTKGRRFSVAGGQGGRRGSILIPDKVYRVSTKVSIRLYIQFRFCNVLNAITDTSPIMS